MKTAWLKILILSAALVCLGATPAEKRSAGENRATLAWTGEWIASPVGPARDEGVFHFRKRLVLKERPAHLVVQVSADNQFALFVNGRFAGNGPASADLNHWRYETIDLAPFLHPGANWIGATVWNFGVNAPLAQVSERTGFYVNSVDKQFSEVETNTTWQVERESGIHSLPKPESISHFYYAANPATHTDATRYDWNWENSHSKGPWRKALSLGVGAPRDAVDPHVNWRFVPDTLPPMEMTLSPAGHVVRIGGIPSAGRFPAQGIVIPAHTKASLLLDHGVLTTAYPELTVSGGKGASLRLTYAEALFDKNGVKGNRNEIAGKTAKGIYDDFLSGGGKDRVFQPLVWRTWRYLEIDIQTTSHPLRLERFRSWFTAYPFEEQGAFTTNDPSLEKIMEIGWRTARLDAHFTYMDTPYWEQLQYVGDSRIEALISYVMSGDDRLARQAIVAINNTRLPDGITLSRGPTSLVQAIPPFSLLWIGMVHDFWMYRDSPEFVQAQLEGTRTVLDWFLQKVTPDGMIGKLPWWPFVDSTFPDNGVPPQDAEGRSAAITLEFVAALREAAEMESALGDPVRAQHYRQAADRSADAVRTLCWNSGIGLVADTPEQTSYSQQTNALAVWLDVIPPAKQQSALRTVLAATDPAFQPPHPVSSPFTITPASYYFRFYVARALDHAGMGDEYTNLLGPWRHMISLGLTTWAETPEPTRSDSHAWSASPNYDLPTIVAGIRPGSPGFRTVRIEPHLGDLTRVSARMPHPRGIISVDLTRAAGSVAAVIRLPDGVTGQLAWQGTEYPLHGGAQEISLKDFKNGR